MGKDFEKWYGDDTLATVWVLQGKVPISVFAHVTAVAPDVGLAMALARHQRRVLCRICRFVAHSRQAHVVRLGAVGIAVTSCKQRMERMNMSEFRRVPDTAIMLTFAYIWICCVKL